MSQVAVPTFDQYADQYDAALNEGLSVSGESKTYFAQGRRDWLCKSLQALGESPQQVLDFGCGTGSSVPLLLEMLSVRTVTGVDVSPESLAVAARECDPERSRFVSLSDFHQEDVFDLAFCNGVFHHIPPVQRLDALSRLYRSLRPGGLFAFWENNPWNPGTRYVMYRIPFDRDAVPISPLAANVLLRRAKFRVLRTDFLFVFPRVLGALRSLEPALSRLPLGAQYLVLCRKGARPLCRATRR